MNGAKQHTDYKFLLLALFFMASIAFLGYYPNQGDFWTIILCFSISFGIYGYWSYRGDEINTKWLIGIAVLVRFILIFTFPNLSDDIYRFIWDGRLLHAGYNPYLHLPSNIVGQHPALSQELYEKLNSPDYYTIYTPINQLINWIATIISSTGYYWESVIYKSVLFICELITLSYIMRLMPSLHLPSHRALIYYLNPLVIIEIMANAHFEGMMVMFLCMSLYYLNQSRTMYASLGIAGAIGAKILPLMFTPAWLNYYYHEKSWNKYIVWTATGCIVLLGPAVYSVLFQGSELSDSIGLYVNKFEFNGSIYYFLRWLGYQIYGFNMIHIVGPLLTVATLLSILYISFRSQLSSSVDLTKVMFYSWLIFLLLSRTIHPWYLIPLIFLGALQKERYYFYTLWSYLITWTYKNYSYTPYFENIAIVSVEYVVVFALIYKEMIHKGYATRVSLE